MPQVKIRDNFLIVDSITNLSRVNTCSKYINKNLTITSVFDLILTASRSTCKSFLYLVMIKLEEGFILF